MAPPKKLPPVDEDEEPRSGKLPHWVYFVSGPNGWRVLMVFLILTMHPMGRGFLTGLGFQFPEQKVIQETKADDVALKTAITALQTSLTDVQKDIQAIKVSNAIVTSEVKLLKDTVTGFQIDYSKYRRNTNETNE